MDRSPLGLIETMMVRDGRIPLWEKHLARLTRSLGELRLPTPTPDVVALVESFLDLGNGVLRLEVSDDGIGGADAALGSQQARGSGLAGLVQRVSTVDGRVDVSSPSGGPTVVTVVLPMKA